MTTVDDSKVEALAEELWPVCTGAPSEPMEAVARYVLERYVPKAQQATDDLEARVEYLEQRLNAIQAGLLRAGSQV
jgi:hypothetical protein